MYKIILRKVAKILNKLLIILYKPYKKDTYNIMVIYMFNLKDAIYVASILGVVFDKYTLEEFLDGINLELEHGTVNQKTNISNDNLITTAKIALAHLNEFPNYYNKEYGIKTFEKFLQTKIEK